MKNTLLLLFSICCLCLNAQVSQQLVKVHNVANLTALNAILLPLAGQMVFVNDIKLTYQYDGTIWKAFSSSTSSTSNQIIDLDSDTKLSVDNGSDNDIIQFNDGSINFKMEGKTVNEEYMLHLGGYASPFSAVQKVVLLVGDSINDILVILPLQEILKEILSKHTMVMSPSLEAVSISEKIASSFYTR